MSWSPQQDAAIKAVQKWLADQRAPQVFRLFGFAGSGKTTLAKHLAADVKGNVVVMSYEANRLKNDGTAEEHETIAKWMRDQEAKTANDNTAVTRAAERVTVVV